MPKNPQPFPKITDQQMEWVIAESELTLEQFQKMLREIGANPFHFGAGELAQGLCEAARNGLPTLSPDGQAFIDMIKSWEPWLWEENEEKNNEQHVAQKENAQEESVGTGPVDQAGAEREDPQQDGEGSQET